MTTTMTATEIKATLLSVLDRVARGEQVEITKRGRVVARLVPATSPHELHGRFAGQTRTVADDEAVFGTGEAWHTP
jgi:prevent-host-death family protein